MKLSTQIIGTGSYIPEVIQTNNDFHLHRFYDQNREVIDAPPEEVTRKFQKITGIAERRYVPENQLASDIGAAAAKRAIEDSGIDPENIDQLIVAHNFGDVIKHTIQSDCVPSLAARIKHRLGIKSPNCVAYDVLFGCPGWVQGVIQADCYFKAGHAKTALVIGAETLSRVLDPHDRDSMIFSDGAGASVLVHKESDRAQGILSMASVSHCIDEYDYIHLGRSNHPEADGRIRYIKMYGRKVYEYALTHVPQAMKDCADKAGISAEHIKKVFIHQANEKLDEAVIHRFYKLYNQVPPDNVMPMSVHELGNSSVATVPTLFDRVCKGELSDHEVNEGDIIMFASVGAGMNINAILYRV